MKPAVVIVGGGPVGLSLAALLASYGVASTVLEADQSYCAGSRAICLSRRSLEILAWADAAKAIQEKALPWTHGRSYYGAREVLSFAMPHHQHQRFYPMVNLQQYYVEQFAHAAGKAYGDLIEVLWDTRLTGLSQRANGVCIEIEHAGETRTLEADYLIACDGGRSTTRELLELPLKGTTYEGRYVIVDIRQKTRRPTERLAWFDPPTNPGSTLLMHRQPDDVWRIDYQLRDDEDPAEAVKPEKVLARVKAHLEWIGEDQAWEALWISIYNAKCLTLDEYRHGRVFFAGDAAHLVPIFGVRGLNSGLDDAGNLAWKLAAVIQGRSPDKLLDSYSQERRAAALINIDFGSRSTEFMAPPSHGFSLLRQATLRLAETTPLLRELINPRQSAPVAYTDSPLNGPDEGFSRRDSAPGCAAPDARIESAGQLRFLTELFGRNWVLLHFQPSLQLADLPGLTIVPITHEIDIDGNTFESYEAIAGTAYLIRPDGYVAARWRHCDPDALRYFFESQHGTAFTLA